MTLRQKQFAVYSTVFLALLLLFFFLHVSIGFTYYSHSHLLAILLGGGTAEEKYRSLRLSLGTGGTGRVNRHGLGLIGRCISAAHP